MAAGAFFTAAIGVFAAAFLAAGLAAAAFLATAFAAAAFFESALTAAGFFAAAGFPGAATALAFLRAVTGGAAVFLADPPRPVLALAIGDILVKRLG
nr:hypothetical protein [uncultured Rhodopila sp.]